MYGEVINLLDKLNIHENMNFRLMLVVVMALLNLDEEECARLLDVSRSTIERWRWGSLCPHKKMRVPIWNLLREEVIKEGNRLEEIKRKG